MQDKNSAAPLAPKKSFLYSKIGARVPTIGWADRPAPKFLYAKIA
jgi:hypothetical protein